MTRPPVPTRVPRCRPRRATATAQGRQVVPPLSTVLNVDAFGCGRWPEGGPVPRRTGVVDLGTRSPRTTGARAPRTVNHRLSVLASFFAYLRARNGERGEGPWANRASPVPPVGPAHGRPGGGDAPTRRRGELRRREPRALPRDLDPQVVARLHLALIAEWHHELIAKRYQGFAYRTLQDLKAIMPSTAIKDGKCRCLAYLILQDVDLPVGRWFP